MVEPVRHRQTKGAATDMFDLQPPRHTSTLPLVPSTTSENERPLIAIGHSKASVPDSASVRYPRSLPGSGPAENLKS